MEHRSGKNERLIGLFLLGIVLFNYPILFIFNREIFIFGIPLLYFYLFSVWLLFIAGVAALTDR